MGIFFTEKRAVPTFPEPVIPPYPGSNIYGQVTPGSSDESALQVPTVWACVSLLSNAVSMLPLETYRDAGGIPQRVKNPPLLTTPAANMTQSEWLHMLMVSLLMRGNAYGRVVARDGQQRPMQVELMAPDNVRVNVDRDTGRLSYALAGKELPTADVWHVRGLTMPGSRVGLSPIAYAAAQIGVDISSRMFAQDFFSGGGIPKAVLQSDQNVNQEQARTIKERLLAATRAREPIVLGQGLAYHTISVSPEESQFLATQMANVGQIARYFNVPAGMVGGNEGGSMTYTNVEQRSLDFLTYAVSFWLKRIEDAVSVGLLGSTQIARFNTGPLLRTDARTQAEVDNMQLAGKVRVPSELRARDGLPPLTKAEQVEADMVPLTITPSGGAKALPALKEPPGPTAPVPTNDPVSMNSAPQFHFHQGDTVIDVAPAELRLEQPIHVQPAEVRQAINVAPAEVRLEQPINVQPAPPAEVRMVTVPATTRSKRVERNANGEITAIVEVE